MAIDINPFGVVGFCATRFTRAAFVLNVFGTYTLVPLDDWKQSFFASLIFRFADAVIPVSQFIKREVAKKVSLRDMPVVNLGVDLERFKAITPTPADPPYIIGVGGIKPRKGYDISLKAFAEVAKTHPTLCYMIVGSHTHDPMYVQSLKTTAHELGVGSRVLFPEHVSEHDLLNLYARASMFILTSVNDGRHVEGFGLVFLEAAACGLPAIGTKDNGIEDAIIEGETGLLVPQYDVAATADAMEKLISDTKLRARMSTSARESVQKRTWGHIAQQYEEIYKGLLK